MIRLPKLFKRNPRTDDLQRGSVGARRTAKNIGPRSLQRSFETSEESLTEDPEQQRARHRLIGSAVLVLIAVVGLPRILDGKPKSVSNDIAVNIVTSLPTPVASMPAAEVKPTPKPETPVDIAPVVKDKESTPPKATSAPVEVSKLATSNSKAPALGLAAGEEVVAAAKPNIETAAKPTSTGNTKYILQIGAFASEDRAKGWISKMKEQKIPNYVLNKNGTDGTKLYVLRAGPFTDKESAEAAEKKVKAMGLSPRLVEAGTQ